MLILTALIGSVLAQAGDSLYVAKPLTQPKQFTAGIEGPQCGPDGTIYAVNFGREQTIGRVTPDGKAELFVALPGKSTGNGIVFDRQGRMYVLGKSPTNVCFGGPDGRTVYVTEVEHTRLVQFRVETPGLAWKRWQTSK
ncbi:MAG: hypothetical protein JSS49_06895 [Planctomycetes bacterium]|nr:hypothetical protein [Planctomycetota bacterium]